MKRLGWGWDVAEDEKGVGTEDCAVVAIAGSYGSLVGPYNHTFNFTLSFALPQVDSHSHDQHPHYAIFPPATATPDLHDFLLSSDADFAANWFTTASFVYSNTATSAHFPSTNVHHRLSWYRYYCGTCQN